MAASSKRPPNRRLSEFVDMHGYEEACAIIEAQKERLGSYRAVADWIGCRYNSISMLLRHPPRKWTPRDPLYQPPQPGAVLVPPGTEYLHFPVFTLVPTGRREPDGREWMSVR